jgi:REP element-mobilizing transposase RayT
MTLYKNKYRAESSRLRGWDYSSPGYYFITICTKNRECLFGEIENGKMMPNKYEEILENCWNDLPNHYPNLKLDQFAVMPNHVHGIIIIENDNTTVDYPNTVVETGLKPVSTETPDITDNTHGLFEFIRALKTFSARRINEQRQTPGISVWQSRFHDHIIRDENELNRIRKYIIDNPANWGNDDENVTEVHP